MSKAELIEELKILSKRYIVPFPIEQTIEDSPELVKKWLDYMKGKAEKESLAQSKFSVIEISWLGPVHVRGQAEREYYLRIDDGSAKVLGFLLTDNPLRVLPVGAMGEGRINKKWLDYEGELSPRTPYNPNKDLKAYHKVLELADCNIKESIDETGKTVYDLELKGTELKGNFRLIQEEKGAPTYTLESLSAGHEFVLHKHYGNGIKEHYDLRWKLASDHKQEMNIYKDPRKLDVGEKAFARVKDVHEDPETLKLWMVTEGTHLFRLVGPLETYIDCLDSGILEILSQTEDEITLKIEGQKLKGMFKTSRVEGGWEFSRIEDKAQKETSELDLALKKKKLELMDKILKEENQSENV